MKPQSSFSWIFNQQQSSRLPLFLFFSIKPKFENNFDGSTKADTFGDDYVNSLTQATKNNNNVDGLKKLQLWKEAVGESQAIEMAREEASRACEEAALANACADEANANAREAMAETAKLKRKFEEFYK
ncbi:unnamed protein product [Vicia faba]|uniref:Uncharacterized protein n=1 Tax=Vicia faba TaxID=3906 RepID=A0AAV0ZEF4_VICFA|nr:unnamed protein product [Vicia faba]